jgi:membrane glycosyltransferase
LYWIGDGEQPVTVELLASAETEARTSRSRVVTGRRAVVGAFGIVTIAALCIELYSIISIGTSGMLAAAMMLAFLMSCIWPAFEFCNSVIGFAIMQRPRRVPHVVWPLAACTQDDDPIRDRIAVVMVVRDEDPREFVARMKLTKASLDRTGSGSSFDYFVLSDSSQRDVIPAEEAAVAEWRSEATGESRIIYRRRESNVGYKPGNVRDFCERWGGQYPFFILLDFDSVMDGPTILRLVRVMQANSHVGIVQTMAVGAMMQTFFSRLMEFSHRHAMRCAMVGSVWWQANRCQFWGHNAVIRTGAFLQHCRLPYLSGGGIFGGHVICHDPIEASLIDRAGLDVLLLPETCGSYEGVPPNLIEFCERDHRWFLGDLMNLKVLKQLPMTNISRFHLAIVPQRFLGWVSLFAFVMLAALAAASWPAEVPFATGAALGLYIAWVSMFLAPGSLSVTDALMSEPARYGGAPMLCLGGIVASLFTIVLTSLSSVGATWFLAKSMLGQRKVVWSGEYRQRRGPMSSAGFGGLWMHTLLGCALAAFLLVAAPGAALWFAPYAASLLLAVPFAVITSSARVERWARRLNLCAAPEAIKPPPELLPLLDR